jgi:hypothetical protein
MKSLTASLEEITDSAAPAPPKRRCDRCPTLLRQSNLGTLCSVCERREIEAQAIRTYLPIFSKKRAVPPSPRERRRELTGQLIDERLRTYRQ